jgi:hypothetical protein
MCSGFNQMYQAQNRTGNHAKKINKETGIVWILMDEYPSAASLQKYFNYRDPLDSILTGYGFILLDSIRSRYPSTLFSINSIFNYDDSITPQSFEAAIHTLKKSAWPADINKAQAGFLNLDFITIGNNEKIKDLACFPDTYRKQLLFGTLFFNAIAATRIGETDQYNSLVNHRLDSVLKKDPDGYKLIWAHFLIPHIPYARNKEGKLLKDYGEAYDKPTAKRHYIDYLAYGNTLVESLLREHPVLQNKIVIISGDHGARFSFVEKKDWNRPYCAVRFPSAFDTSSLQKINYISQLPAFLAGYAEATVFTR